LQLVKELQQISRCNHTMNTLLIAFSTLIGLLFGATLAYFYCRKRYQSGLIYHLNEKLSNREQEIRILHEEIHHLRKKLQEAQHPPQHELQKHLQELQKRISELHLKLYQQQKMYEEKLRAHGIPTSPVSSSTSSDSLPDQEEIQISVTPQQEVPPGSDPLTLIEGITPEIQQRLYQLGIYRFDDIAQWSSFEIKQVAHALGIDSQTIINQNWILQAQMLWFERYRA